MDDLSCTNLEVRGHLSPLSHTANAALALFLFPVLSFCCRHSGWVGGIWLPGCKNLEDGNLVAWLRLLPDDPLLSKAIKKQAQQEEKK